MLAGSAQNFVDARRHKLRGNSDIVGFTAARVRATESMDEPAPEMKCEKLELISPFICCSANLLARKAAAIDCVWRR
jgi:hypothetical protein